MDNFVFSPELELSILEHRVELLLKMLAEIEVDAFFPAIIYNESFWKLGYEKKLSILRDKQSIWVGENPINRTILYKDQFLQDIVKSVKITYFNYTKIDLENFIKILTTKSKFSVTDFESFGDTNSQTLSLVNDLILKQDNLEKIPNDKILLSKIEAIKFYSHFPAKNKLNCLIIIYNFDFDYWKNFFESLRKLDEAGEKKLFESSKFTFLFINQIVKDNFEKKYRDNNLFQSENFEFEYAEINSIEFKQKYDYIFLDSVLSSLPTNILIKYGSEFFHAFGRLAYLDRSDPKKALEDIALLTSPIKQLDISEEILNNLDYEMTWRKFDSDEEISILENAKVIHERAILRFSIISLKLIIKLIKASNKNALIHIWDFSENSFSKYLFGIFQDENHISRSLVDFNLSKSILELFEDINVKSNIYSSSEILATEILQDKDGFVRLEEVMDFVNMEKEYLQQFFDVKNYTFYEDLKRVSRGLNFFSNLKEKNVVLFGLPTLLYNAGFNIFSKNILKNPKLKEKLHNQKGLDNFNLKSYEKEFYRNILPIISEKLNENKGILITKDKENKNNKELRKLLGELSINEDYFFEFINKYWDEISDLSKHKASYKLMEVVVQ